MARPGERDLDDRSPASGYRRRSGPRRRGRAAVRIEGPPADAPSARGSRPSRAARRCWPRATGRRAPDIGSRRAPPGTRGSRGASRSSRSTRRAPAGASSQCAETTTIADGRCPRPNAASDLVQGLSSSAAVGAPWETKSAGERAVTGSALSPAPDPGRGERGLSRPGPSSPPRGPSRWTAGSPARGSG